MGFVEAYNNTLKLILKIWDTVSNRPKRKLENERRELEKKSLEAQMKGDINEMQRIRAQIIEIDRRLAIGDY